MRPNESTVMPPVFHAGERAMQARAGVAQRLAEVGPRVMREHMPDQHREFFRQLPWLIAGSVDAQGQPWASVLVGEPGFVQSPTAQRLVVHAAPLPGDPLAETLRLGAPIGLLGIEPHTRRRNRANGVVDSLDASRFELSIQQSFGNCPKYIRARQWHALPADRAPQPVLHSSDRLDATAQRLIRESDTYFIASAYPKRAADTDRAHGVDVSHRGGRAGFVRIDDDRTLTAPDLVGNFFFNTLGNLSLNPRAGLLFVDFDSGSLLYVAVQAQIIEDEAEVASFDGAERLLRFTVCEVRRIDGAMALAWSDGPASPALESVGGWSEDQPASSE